MNAWHYRLMPSVVLAASLSLTTVAHAGPGFLELHKSSGLPVYIAPHAIISVHAAPLTMPWMTTGVSIHPTPPEVFEAPQSCLTLTLLEACGGDSGRSVNAVICVTESVDDIVQRLAQD